VVKIWEENRSESYSRSGLTTKRTLRVEPYTERGLVMEMLLGGIELVNDRLVRILPAADPWFPWLYCSEVTCNPVEILNSPGDENGLAMLATANYSESARLEATYTLPEFDPNKSNSGSGSEQQEKEFATESFDYKDHSQLLPQSYFKIVDGTDQILLPQEGLQATKVISKVDYAIMRHFVLRLPHDAMTRLASRVNKSAFVMPGFVWPPECLRYAGSTASRKFTNKGAPYYDLGHRFEVQPTWDKIADPVKGTFPTTAVDGNNNGYVGHNRIFRAKTGEWIRPQLATGPDRPVYLYDEDIQQTVRGAAVTGFSLLFQPAAA
jgi:hypothetical protein